MDEESRPPEAPVTRIDLDPEPVDPDEPTFAPGPPSIAEDLYGGAVLRPRVSGERQVVLHTREGQALRGSLRDAELDGPILPLETRGGTVRVPVDRIRAVCFIVPIGDPLPEPQGRQARVVFEDGRPVAGLVAEYRHEATGFFLMPLDGRGRTERIFVYRDAIRSIQFVD